MRDIAKYGHDSNLKSSLYEVGAGFEINTWTPEILSHKTTKFKYLVSEVVYAVPFSAV